MGRMYQTWKYGKVLATLRHYAIYYQADEVWMAMYTWIRSQVFLSAELDPKQAMRAAKKAWEDFTVPQGALTWKILDDLQLSLNEVRLHWMLAGTFSIFNQANLEEELDDLKHKCKKDSPLYRAF